MNDKSINEQYTYIRTLIEEKRLKEALMQLESLLWQCPDWDVRTRFEQLQTSYKYMLDYMRQGTIDPERWNVYRKLMADTWEVADRVRIKLLDNASSKYYHEVRRSPKSEDLSTYNLKKLLEMLEGFNDDLEVSRLISEKKTDEVLMLHEDTLKFMFLETWTNSAWTSEEKEYAQSMLDSELLSVNDLCLFTSAVTLSLMENFDYRKIMWLLDAYLHSDVHVKQRALVGAILIFYIYQKRLAFYPELFKRVYVMCEDPTFTKDITCIYHQLLLCQETEKIDRKMRDEIIPEMLKNASNMSNLRFGLEDNDEDNDDQNPDWQDAFEQSGLGDKLREITELQQEGADVYMSTFAPLKGYPFFREIHNWFYPFSKQQSDVVKQLRQDGVEKNSMLELILQMGIFSNNDKYSLFFTIHQLPKTQQEMMLTQLNEQMEADFTDKSNTQNLKEFNERSSTVSSQYLHDLYRFLKLCVRRHEFRDIFIEKLNLHHIPILNAILYNPETLFPIADFYIKKERWEEAIDVYTDLESKGEFKDKRIEEYQKFGFALQKCKKYKEAIEAYLKADMLKPDSVWNDRHLATCYRLIHNYQAALSYYKKVELTAPNDANIIFQIANCLVELERNEEALNYFFKLDFIESNSVKAWRGIGWCSFINQKHEQALKYYEKIIGLKPLSIDYMNAGHAAWAMGNISKAADFYGRSVVAYGNREQFLNMFKKDKEALLKQGIAEEDIPLMLDLL